MKERQNREPSKNAGIRSRCVGADLTHITNRLQPWGAVACRLVDAKGQPRPDVELESGRASDPLDLFVAEPIKTDRDSRFRIDGLVSGRKYHFNIRVYDPAAAGTVIEGQAISGLSVKAGETRDLGDVRSKRFR